MHPDIINPKETIAYGSETETTPDHKVDKTDTHFGHPSKKRPGAAVRHSRRKLFGEGLP